MQRPIGQFWGPMAAGMALLLGGAVHVHGQTVAFRDEFEGALGTGWEWINEDTSFYNFTSKPGSLRVFTQRGGLGANSEPQNFLVRSVTGDFIIETKVEYDPTVAQQSAGLVVYETNAAGVALGLSFAVGERGAFRGIGYISSEGTPESKLQTGTFYNEDNSENPNVVYLRILRNGQEFVSAFSPDGVTFYELTTFTNNSVSETVLVGLGASNGDYDGCGSACDQVKPADFDFFQLSLFGDGGDGEPQTPILQSLTIGGPDEVAAGESIALSVVGAYNDGSEEDVTSQVSWSLAPAEMAEIQNGTLTAYDLTETRQVTVIADMTQTVAGTVITRTSTHLVRINVSSDPSVAPTCGMQAGSAAMVSMLALGFLSRFRRFGDSKKQGVTRWDHDQV